MPVRAGEKWDHQIQNYLKQLGMEIAKKSKISLQQAEEINSIIFSVDNISSLDVPVTEDADSLKKETIKDSMLKTPEAITEIIRNSQNVQHAIKYLPEREGKIIELRFGIGDTPTYSLDEIGKMFKLSRERVRQIELKAFQRLKGVFLRLKYADKNSLDKLALDQRGTLPDRRQSNKKTKVEHRKKKDRRKTWK